MSEIVFSPTVEINTTHFARQFVDVVLDPIAMALPICLVAVPIQGKLPPAFALGFVPVVVLVIGSLALLVIRMTRRVGGGVRFPALGCPVHSFLAFTAFTAFTAFVSFAFSSFTIFLSFTRAFST
jgi:hypothetical protein